MSRTQSSTGVKKKDVMKRENSPKIFPGATGDEIEGLFLLPSSPVYNFSCFICAKKAFTTLPLLKLMVFRINQAHNRLFEFLRQNNHVPKYFKRF